MSKTYKSTGRHQGEIWENGQVIDRAHGRKSVWEMRTRHGLWPADYKPKNEGTENLPTAFEGAKP